MGLLIITKTVDEDDQLLGFFIGWLREFAKKYDRINVLCLEKGNFNLPENVGVISLGKDRGLPKIMWLNNLYREAWKLRHEYNSVFVHMNAIYVVVASWLWKLMGKKVFLWYAHKTITWQHRVAEKFADGIFASTPQGFRLKTPKLHIVGQGIDTSLFKPTTNYQLLTTNLKILSVGRIAPIKNYEALIDSAEILHKKGIDFAITIVGAPVFHEDIEYEKKLKELVRGKRLEGKIKFTGKISNKDLPGYYQSHNIYINLSRTGSLDKTILEAMASGCTVLSSNDSAREFLPSELIIFDNDGNQLADKILEVRGGNYSEKLRQYVIDNHSVGQLIEKITKIINSRNPNK
ncbi:MAG: glycosyltransferase family 4 protein [bacterium]|nr:glycosyltransferase family 4 protein [bacterium]